jgi:hypothetical protein
MLVPRFGLPMRRHAGPRSSGTGLATIGDLATRNPIYPISRNVAQPSYLPCGSAVAAVAAHCAPVVLGPSAAAVAALLSLSASVLLQAPGAALAVEPASWTGPARVVDGDTLYIGEVKFRLYGVCWPAVGQCGREERKEPKPVRCS